MKFGVFDIKQYDKPGFNYNFRILVFFILRAGDSKGSLLVTPGFERLQYVLLHTNGKGCQLFKLKSKGTFQIWTKETLEKYGFSPSHALYYIVLHFDSKGVIDCKYVPNLKEKVNTFVSKIRPLSDFIGLKQQV